MITLQVSDFIGGPNGTRTRVPDVRVPCTSDSCLFQLHKCAVYFILALVTATLVYSIFPFLRPKTNPFSREA